MEDFYPDITKLYHYCAYDKYALEMLVNRQMYMRNPKEFNDPFDCSISIREQCSDEHYQERLTLAAKHLGFEPESIVRAFDGTDKDDETTKNLIKCIREVEGEGDGFRVACFSEKNDDVLMWSHYAGKHTGFCIGFTRDPGNILGKHARKVQYYEYFPEIIWIFKKFKDSFHRECMRTTKAHFWEHEAEWRLINDGTPFEPLPGEIDSIIFGLCMPEQHRNTVKALLSDQKQVVFKEAKKADRRFGVDIVEIRAMK